MEEVIREAISRRDDSILQLIGDTDVIEHPERSSIRCKMEVQNPMGSMKDRIGFTMVKHAQDEGKLDDGPVVESSSGNTAAGVALAANRLGHECHITLPKGTSEQKINNIRAMGATVHQCPSVSDTDNDNHYTSVAEELAEDLDGFWLDQYHNELNPLTHYVWTGKEVVEQMTEDTTHFVGVMGTGGTVSGIGRAIQESEYDVDVVGVDAFDSNISNEFYGEDLGEYDTEIEGLGKGHKLPTMWFDYIDEIRDIEDEHTLGTARYEWQKNGFFVGTSAAAAIEIAVQTTVEEKDAQVMTLICDGGEKYVGQVLGQ